VGAIANEDQYLRAILEQQLRHHKLSGDTIISEFTDPPAAANRSNHDPGASEHASAMVRPTCATR
jgi:hypothetical protein